MLLHQSEDWCIDILAYVHVKAAKGTVVKHGSFPGSKYTAMAHLFHAVQVEKRMLIRGYLDRQCAYRAEILLWSLQSLRVQTLVLQLRAWCLCAKSWRDVHTLHFPA